jgi:uncharacterized tellurite resistance protein B-like protein
MQNSEFNQLLFKVVFYAMACDGEIHESELAELKEMLESSPYFNEVPDNTRFNQIMTDFKNKGAAVIADFIAELNLCKLQKRQGILLTEALIRMIEADGDIAKSEIFYLQQITKALKLENKDLMIRFPNHISLWLNDFVNEEELEFESIEANKWNWDDLQKILN